ncbi:macrophage migration inhibitory factor-like [Osmerus eperlanus]|uniref:macrophage migration inhibitory factor-like n=1 Tax=Osmerus eperlanus TaxID=29151 RepID=UPI002E0F9C9A
MPVFVVHTNVAKEDVPQELYSEATVELAKAMCLPEKYFCINIIGSQTMTFGGTSEPCAHCDIRTIGRINEEQNIKYSKLLCGLLKKHLGIPSNRMYVDFFDFNPQNVAHDNSVFSVILSGKP